MNLSENLGLMRIPFFSVRLFIHVEQLAENLIIMIKLSFRLVYELVGWFLFEKSEHKGLYFYGHMCDWKQFIECRWHKQLRTHSNACGFDSYYVHVAVVTNVSLPKGMVSG